MKSTARMSDLNEMVIDCPKENPKLVPFDIGSCETCDRFVKVVQKYKNNQIIVIECGGVLKNVRD